MFDRYIVTEDSLRNVDDGTAGFAFGIRCGYYRRLRLSMIEDLQVVVDGEEMPREQIRFSLPGGDLRSICELKDLHDEAWEFGDVATITVQRPGGLPKGAHALTFSQRFRISYAPVPTVQTLAVVQVVE
ncbi:MULTISPECIES: DUF6379 domain-containing protein [unclassified Arthrobacter]|uniref:C-glycoside deglycosidase beta subunit domain-containing protein n=1 Tax=unclassified Arthrobacter TaxID=235627 RepID=UPI001C85D6E3|nr:DUF6379 domain-containing protein [Arthrobacter sp. MAHUQ-56]MBX7445928.1 hypothetical protein [Arthrobacter sp. MAHUQ-56]